MNLNFGATLSTFLITFALAFIIFALVPGGDLLLLAKLVALAFGITLLSPVWYPHIRGVRKGDRVSIVGMSPFVELRSKYGLAQTNGRLGNAITVITDDGSEVLCEVVAYAGMFSHAKVKIKDNAQVIEVR